MAINENKITRHPVSSLCALCDNSQAFETSLFPLRVGRNGSVVSPTNCFFSQIAVITRDVADGRLMLLDKLF